MDERIVNWNCRDLAKNRGFWWNFWDVGVGFWAENGAWRVNVQRLGKIGNKKARKMGVKVYKS
ncbi:MAG: hypothetical protein ACYTEQ_16230 [Planctomycetota bacterium]